MKPHSGRSKRGATDKAMVARAKKRGEEIARQLAYESQAPLPWSSFRWLIWQRELCLLGIDDYCHHLQWWAIHNARLQAALEGLELHDGH